MHELCATRREHELMAENAALHAQLAEFVAQAARNQAIMQRHQAFDLEIVGATSFPHLVQTIFSALPVSSDLDIVTLTLIDPGADIHTVMHKLGTDFSAFPNLIFSETGEELGFASAPGLVARPRLGPYFAARHAPMFPHCRSRLASVALVPLLRNRRLLGCLNLGSHDPQRFMPGMATDFIEHMASIIAICLENVISNEMLKYIGLTDALTGVYNRRYIDRRLHEEIGRARRQQYNLSVMYIDIDYFKQVNDRIGHQAGDDVLREVARRIKAELRMSDALGRFGGEEFVVLLIDADLDSAAAVAERIRASVAGTPVELACGEAIGVSVSIGVAMLDTGPHDEPIEATAHHLLARADAALYVGKEQGRNRVVTAA